MRAGKPFQSAGRFEEFGIHDAECSYGSRKRIERLLTRFAYLYFELGNLFAYRRGPNPFSPRRWW